MHQRGGRWFFNDADNSDSGDEADDEDDSIAGATRWLENMNIEENVNLATITVRTNVSTNTPLSEDQYTQSSQRRASRKRLADVAVHLLMNRVVSSNREGAAVALELSVRIPMQLEAQEEENKEN
jgi:hypothetical protein